MNLCRFEIFSGPDLLWAGLQKGFSVFLYVYISHINIHTLIHKFLINHREWPLFSSRCTCLRAARERLSENLQVTEKHSKQSWPQPAREARQHYKTIGSILSWLKIMTTLDITTLPKRTSFVWLPTIECRALFEIHIPKQQRVGLKIWIGASCQDSKTTRPCEPSHRHER